MLADENARYARSGGVSKNNRDAGFVPAYRNPITGRVVLSRLADGQLAPVHTLDGLPADWIELRDSTGKALQLISEVVAGFCRKGRFYTRKEAAEAMRNGDGRPPPASAKRHGGH